jgi:CYTH domain-containing protein
MSTAHVFLLAPSVARLIEKERDGRHVRQGYFPDRPGRGTHVQLEQETGRLILVSNYPNGPVEEATGIPSSQAEALLGLAAGQVEYLEVNLDIGSQTAILRRFLTPEPLDLITVTLEHGKRARKVQPLAWFGPEVTGDPAYQGRTMAPNGLPSVPEVESQTQRSTACSMPWRAALEPISRKRRLLSLLLLQKRLRPKRKTRTIRMILRSRTASFANSPVP